MKIHAQFHGTWFSKKIYCMKSRSIVPHLYVHLYLFVYRVLFYIYSSHSSKRNISSVKCLWRCLVWFSGWLIAVKNFIDPWQQSTHFSVDTRIIRLSTSITPGYNTMQYTVTHQWTSRVTLREKKDESGWVKGMGRKCMHGFTIVGIMLKMLQ